jgi:hypothetical protein
MEIDTIRRLVGRVRRRLFLGTLGRATSWTLCLGLTVAVFALAAGKFWPQSTLNRLSSGQWLLSGLVAGVLGGLLWSWWKRPTMFQAALEADLRCGLKERLSSALSLAPSDSLHGAEMALIHDAARRAERAEIPEHFPLRPQPRGLLPLLPLAALPFVLLLPERGTASAAPAPVNATEVASVKEAAKQLQAQLRQQRKQAEAQGLQDAQMMLKKMEDELDKLQQRKEIDRKEALVTLNDFKKQLEQRRDALGDSEQLKRNLGSVRNVNDGPLEKAAKALEKGDLSTAEQELNELAAQLREGKLDEQQQQALAKQAQQLAEKLNEIQQQRETKQRQLEEQLAQANRDGRAEDAAKLQQQLDQMKKGAKQDRQLEQLSQSLQSACAACEQGNGKQAASALESAAGQLSQMQRELDELENLAGAIDELSDCKSEMSEGKGASRTQGAGKGEGTGDFARGEGRGSGKRAEEHTETSAYDSQVRDKPRNGQSVVSGFADGPNRKGVTREEVRQAIQSAASQKADPVEEQALPPAERDQAQQYFDRFRGE